PLRIRNSILVLTGDLARESLESLAVVKLAAQVTDILDVLEKNLRYREGDEALPLSKEQVEMILEGNLSSKITPFLTTPFHIHQFCSKLPSVVPEAKDKRAFERVVLRVAKEVAIGGSQATREWFGALHPN